ncbi:MAG: NAD(P)H-binding protein, partial [Bacteroidales bacterium]|nr:NAD(P)H-binding protein [Bacteroidales bacterium]
VLGATGLVGKQLVEQLILDELFSKIILLHRRATGFKHEKVEEYLVDFNDVNQFKVLIRGDVLFSCLGTTLQQAGSKEEQFKVDYTYQYEFAQAAAENGVLDYVLVSSSGANARSMIFYTKMKGKLDEAVQKLGFKRVLIFRPSLLLGYREQKRAGEALGAKIMSRIQNIPYLKKYRGIKGEEVAQAMISAYKRESQSRLSIFTLNELFDLI